MSVIYTRTTAATGLTQLTIYQPISPAVTVIRPEPTLGGSHIYVPRVEMGLTSFHSSTISPIRPIRPLDAPPASDAIQASRPLPAIAREPTTSNELPPPQCYICHPDHDDAKKTKFVCTWDESNCKPHDPKEKLASTGHTKSDMKAGTRSGAISNVEGFVDPRSRFRRFTDGCTFFWRGANALSHCESALDVHRHLFGQGIYWDPAMLLTAASSLHLAQLKVYDLRSLCEDRAPEIRGGSDAYFARKLDEIDLAIKEELKKLHEFAREQDDV